MGKNGTVGNEPENSAQKDENQTTRVLICIRRVQQRSPL